MKRNELNRRDFNRLTAAAFGGIVAGTAIGCGGDDDADRPTPPSDPGRPGDDHPAGSGTSGADDTTPDKAETDVSLVLEEPHVCRGLNACQGMGKQKDNDCAGLSTCATAEHHSCHGENACKGQGGCEDTVGRNTCKGEGKCAVPLGENAWETARAALKKALEAKGKKLNDPPPKG